MKQIVLMATLLAVSLGARAESVAEECAEAAWNGMSCQAYREFIHPRSLGGIVPPTHDARPDLCIAESDLAAQVAQMGAKGVPIEAIRAKYAKVLSDNGIPTGEYNRYMRMVNRAYEWQQKGYTPEQVKSAEIQACRDYD